MNGLGNRLTPYDPESEEEMPGRSAEDILDDGAMHTTDEEDLAMMGELLGDELTAPAPAPAVDDDDEFAALLNDEPEVIAPAQVVAAEVNPTAMISDMDEFDGLEVPSTDDAPTPAVAEEQQAAVDTPSDENTLDELDELGDLDDPADPVVVPPTPAEPAQAAPEESIDDLEALEIQDNTQAPPDDDAFEVTSADQNDVPANSRSESGRKAGETRRKNREAAERAAREAEGAPVTQEDGTTAAVEAYSAPAPEGTVIQPTGKTPATETPIEFTPSTFTPGSLIFSPPGHKVQMHEVDDLITRRIHEAIAREQESYGEVTPRDLYFYRLGVDQRMRDLIKKM